jgi:hypothetical protein
MKASIDFIGHLSGQKHILKHRSSLGFHPGLLLSSKREFDGRSLSVSRILVRFGEISLADSSLLLLREPRE